MVGAAVEVAQDDIHLGRAGGDGDRWGPEYLELVALA